MQPSSAELERQVRERTEALQTAYRQLENLQAKYQTLVEQLAAERQRAESLVELSNRFGVR